MEKVLELKNITRDYNVTSGVIKRKKSTVHAVKNISFDVYRGEIFGLLGPNGAGKTTLIKMMTTLLTPTSGELRVLGCDCIKQEKIIRPKINFVFGGERNLYWRLSAEDNLLYFSDLYLIPTQKQKKIIPELLRTVGLYDDRKRKVETYSKGMKQRLQIAKALLNEPDVLFLDEPTIGLDPVVAKELRIIIRELAQKNTTVILTTHYMPEAEELCDRIAIINNGKLVALDNIGSLRNQIDEPVKLRIPIYSLQEKDYQYLKTHSNVTKVLEIEKNNFVDVYSYDIIAVLQDLIEHCGQDKLRGIQVQDVTLEDVYIDIVGGSREL